jgi:hypothetical protein
VHAPTEEKSDESKVRCYEELAQMFDYFPKCHMKFQLGNFNAKFGERLFSNLKLGMRVYMGILIKMVLQQ